MRLRRVGRSAGAAGRLTAAAAVLTLAAAASAQPGEWPRADTRAGDGPAGDNPTWRLGLHSDRHSDALPLADWGQDNWAALRPRSGRNLAYLDEQLHLQRRQGPWTLGLVARSQATLVASNDSLALAAQLAEPGARANLAGGPWQADVRLRGFSGAGLSAAFDLAPPGAWQAGLSVEALALGRWRERRLAGTVANAGGGSSTAFALQSDEVDDRLEAPFQRAFARRGGALLFGLQGQWQQGAWTARGALRDLGWLHWRGVPQQQWRLDTDTLGQDSDGFLAYRPLLAGQNRQTGLTRRAPWQAALALDHALDPRRSLSLQSRLLEGFGLLPALQWQQRSGTLHWTVGWQLHERRATATLAWGGWRLQAGADRLGSRAHSRQLALTWQGRLD